MSESNIKIKGYLVWGICAVFFLYEFFLRTVIGTFQHEIMVDFHLSSISFSLMSSTIFFITYGIMQIPVGIIIDMIGLKKALAFASLACGLSSIAFSCADSYTTALVYRAIMGLRASFGFIGVLIAVYDWMPRKYIAIFIGLSQFIGTLGPIIAAGPLESLLESSAIRWRAVFLYLGIIGSMLAVLILSFVENNKEKESEYTILKRPEKVSRAISRLFKRADPWYIAIFSTCLYFTIEYLSENEGRAFLALKGIDITATSFMLSVSWLGYAVGCPMLGFASDMLEIRKRIMSICAVLSLISIVTIVYIKNDMVLLVAFFLLGFSASVQTLAFAMMAEQFQKQFVAVGFGLNNTMITIISSINAPLIGLLLDSNKNGPTLTLENYYFAFNNLIIIAVLGIMISLFFIKETYCKSIVSFTILKVTK